MKNKTLTEYVLDLYIYRYTRVLGKGIADGDMQ